MTDTRDSGQTETQQGGRRWRRARSRWTSNANGARFRRDRSSADAPLQVPVPAGTMSDVGHAPRLGPSGLTCHPGRPLSGRYHER